jgi:hypothetical protein
MSYLQPSEIVCGGADGIDHAGDVWATVHMLPVKYFLPNWLAYGRQAGPIRNRRMAEYADALFAVWDGKSPGTKNMIKEMLSLGKPIFTWTFKKELQTGDSDAS